MGSRLRAARDESEHDDLNALNRKALEKAGADDPRESGGAMFTRSGLSSGRPRHSEERMAGILLSA
jgi:hypothetical protein